MGEILFFIKVKIIFVLLGEEGDVFELLNDMTVYEKMSQSHNPYGDGKASLRIREFIINSL